MNFKPGRTTVGMQADVAVLQVVGENPDFYVSKHQLLVKKLTWLRFKLPTICWATSEVLEYTEKLTNNHAQIFLFI